MFSGLVRNFAKVRFYENRILCLESDLYPQTGDSIAVNGACLTAIESKKDYFCVELSQTTAQTIALENLRGLVHIEPALLLKDRLHGHIVQGHIDCIGTIVESYTQNNQHVFRICVDTQTLILMIEKGSVCVDGISLTINRVLQDSFELVLIPHTMHNTLFHSYKIGRRVNIETDVIVRSIAHIMQKFLVSTSSNANDKLSYFTNNPTLTQEIYDMITLGY